MVLCEFGKLVNASIKLDALTNILLELRCEVEFDMFKVLLSHT